MRLRLLCLLGLMILPTPAAIAAPPTTAPAEPVGMILGARSSWRAFAVWKTEQMRVAGGDLEFVPLIKGQPTAPICTVLPAADWTRVEFDDADWARFAGLPPSGSRHLLLLCLRGRFVVDDPAAVKDLVLSLTYRGGAIVYLNGQEIARGHLPAGKVEPEMLAEDYPKDAYVDTDGHLLRLGFGDPGRFPERFALRQRRLAAVTVPASALRKGVNVLAIEVHRAPTAEVQIKGRSKTDQSYGPAHSQWSMLAVEQVSLSAPAEAAGAVAQPRPSGLVVWPRSVVERARPGELPEPAGSPAPVRIVGCRNGAFNGQIVAAAAGPIRNLKAEVSELRLLNGDGRIASDAVQVRWTLATGDLSVERWFDGLEEFAPPSVAANPVTGLAAQPIWLTVRISADAKPGDYAGKVTVSADGWPAVEAPIALKVVDWLLPKPHEFISQVGLIQSPESVALHYNVELWSEAHWKLIDRSFERMAAVGADDVYIPMLCKTVLGNEHGMVRWIKQADGGYKYDFSLADKYLEIAARHLIKPPVVCLYLWDRQGGEWMGWGTRKFEQTEGPKVTVLDPGTGNLSVMEGPKWGTPQALEFWKPVIEQTQQLLANHGLADSLMFGIAMDQRPPQETIDQLKAIAPNVPWVIHSHGPPTDVLKGQPIGYGAHVHVTHSLSEPAVKRAYGWRTKNLFCAFPRYGAGGAGALRGLDLGVYRGYIESMFVSGHRGVGRVGADFWPVLGRKGRQETVYCRYDVEKVSIQIDDSNEAMLAPGRDGPISTAKLEMLREGVQEVEARVFIEKALLDPASKAKLGDELAARCQNLLDDRTRQIIIMVGGYRVFGGVIPNWPLFQASDWQQQSRQLYEAAAEVARSLASK